MKTLVFCTAYARAAGDWQTRYRLWLRAVRRPALAADTVLLVDDGSESLPGWPGLTVASGRSQADAAAAPEAPLLLFHFQRRLGRQALYDFPGWHRSFAFGALYGEAHGFDRIIHLESDAHILSERGHRWLRETRDQWAALWSARYNFPEMAIQVAAGSGVAQLAEFAQRPYDEIRDRMHETALPFTQVERGLIGERYGEDQEQIPAEADYCAQVQPFREPNYYWWLEGTAPTDAPALIDWQFGRAGGLSVPVLDGWSNAEPAHRWMIGLESTILLPNLPVERDLTLLLTALPHVRPDRLPRQRLFAFLNDMRIGEYEISLAHPCILGFRIPRGVLRAEGNNRLRLLHPDARQPSQFGAGDTRHLAVAVQRLKILAA